LSLSFFLFLGILMTSPENSDMSMVGG